MPGGWSTGEVRPDPASLRCLGAHRRLRGSLRSMRTFGGMMSEPAPVVVGVDGSAFGRDALDWAAAEAATRGRPLWVVHACPPPVDTGPLGPVPSLSPYTGTSDVLQEAARRAQLVAPEVEVTTRLVSGGPVPALLGQRAGLIVVGSRGQSGVRRALAGSVSVAVSAHAQCPVVVVPPL